MVNIQTQTFNLQCFYFLCYIILMQEIFKAQKCGMRFLWVNFWSGDSYGF